MKGRGVLGVSGVASALLTIMLLVAGFAASAGLLSAVYVSQAEAMRKAVNVGEAVSERLQAYVYEDVRTNRTLLTVRNVGATGSEVEYLMAVGYNGEVLAEVRPAETLKLGTQQALTVPLADLLGPGFDNYTQVRSVMATLYLKTVKGGVFGSGYMAPPSVMTAAYATSTTTVSTTETSTESVQFPTTGTITVTSWNATVIIPNPNHWPVHAYAGVAFMRNMPTSVNQTGWSGSLDVGMVDSWRGSVSFPSWGLQPGLRATDQSGQVRNVAASDIRLPRYVACASNNNQNSYTMWTDVPRNFLVASFSEVGPVYFVKSYTETTNPPNIGNAPICGVEGLATQGMTRRLVGPTTVVFPTSTGTLGTYTTTGRTTITSRSTITRTITETYSWRWTTYIVTRYTVSTTTTTLTTTFTSTTTITGTHTAYSTFTAQTSTDLRDSQFITFPGIIKSVTSAYWDGGYASGWFHYTIAYKLAYVKVVNLWNTTEVLAYIEGPGTAYVRADRPLGVAAVYVFDGVHSTVPPPPPPPPPCYEWRSNPVCYSPDVNGQIEMTSPLFFQVPCGTPSEGSTITATTTNPNCNGFITSGSGTVSASDAQQCDKNGNEITCTRTSPDQYVIWDCDH